MFRLCPRAATTRSSHHKNTKRPSLLHISAARTLTIVLVASSVKLAERGGSLTGDAGLPRCATRFGQLGSPSGDRGSAVDGPVRSARCLGGCLARPTNRRSRVRAAPSASSPSCAAGDLKTSKEDSCHAPLSPQLPQRIASGTSGSIQILAHIAYG